MDKSAIRNAATVIVVRDPGDAPKVLMGQRGAKAAFMPNKFVFPGGALDPGDHDVPLDALPEPCTARMAHDSTPGLASGLLAAAIRELWEETGLALGRPWPWPGAVPHDWAGFADLGLVPDATNLRFVFRAITPPGRPRRFDARFFLVDASQLWGDPDDFSRASDELSHLQWIPLPEMRNFTLPFITEVVLAEVAAALPGLGAPDSVPFFDNRHEESVFRRL
ncbi:DNA mismatch repair protein MutT [Candidatus Rhodobacter oscarellae]|uniref:DNA mismatch repair protein MutT n=1 Tax=Candidatus Rhodobacter oscarellae TaxID=1675527 RepID=A0A0J9EBQ1_9RHOB|nr:DNA mismatch repair protein MutT [Candidatus Rhodobacter lobularis]